MTDTLRDRLGAAIDMAFYEAEQHVPAKDGHCDKCGFCHCSVGHVLAMAQEGVHAALAAQPAPAVMGETVQNEARWWYDYHWGKPQSGKLGVERLEEIRQRMRSLGFYWNQAEHAWELRTAAAESREEPR